MMARAEALSMERRARLGESRSNEDESKRGNFMGKLQSEAYMGAHMNLEERLNRNKHYRARETEWLINFEYSD